MRTLGLVFAGLLVMSGAALADMDSELAGWRQPDGVVSQENDPFAPFVSFFTPTYSDADQVATWSMMAARWRDSGRIDLSVGVRLVHAGEPWNIRAASVRGDDLAIDTFRSIRTCNNAGRCIQRETASIALPVLVLKNAAAEGVEIRITTSRGPDRLIKFPADIMEQLYRQAGADDRAS